MFRRLYKRKKEKNSKWIVTKKITYKSIYEIKRTIYYFYYYYLLFKSITRYILGFHSFYRQNLVGFNFKENSKGCRIVW